MSDYWVSRGKYWHVEAIACLPVLDAPLGAPIARSSLQMTNHQGNTTKEHKGNVERYVRDVYKKGEKDTKEAAQLASTMAKINAAAGDTAPSASTSAAPVRKAPKGTTSSDPYANYSNAASLGLFNEEADKLMKEANAKRTESKVGQWEVVSRPKPPPPRASLAPVHADDEEASHKHFAQEKKAPGLEELWDPGKVTFKIKKRKKAGEAEAKEEAQEVKEEPKLRGFKLAVPKQPKQESPQEGASIKQEEPMAEESKKRKAEGQLADPPAVRPKVEQDS